jgi:chemotaxis protein MotB
MTSPKMLLAGMLVVLAAGCGVPEQKYKAALAEQERAMQSARAEADRATALERQLADQRARLEQAELARKAAQADAEQQRHTAGQLARTKEQLEAERLAAAGEAERQRQTAARLEEEKRTLEKKSTDYQALAGSLDQEIKAGRVQVSELQGKLTVRMSERVLFPSASATISREGQATLKSVAGALQSVQGRIVRVEGHTDNVPIHTERFPSNWELSAGRAIAVVRFLQAQGIDAVRLGAAGYSEYQPIASNDTPEGRAQNRRIEISLALPPSSVSELGPTGR